MEPSDPRRLSQQQQQQPHHHHHVMFCPHHHHCQHHHHYMALCPNHHHHHHHHHLLLSSSFSRNPEARAAVPAENQFESEPAAFISEVHPLGKLLERRLEDGEDAVVEGAKEEEEEEEEDPIFVLTDEWREYFANSEAKRRLAKKMAKKGGK